MIEATGAIDYIFAVVIAVVISNWVAGYIYSEGRYEADVEREFGKVFLPAEPPHALLQKTASDVMATPVIGFRYDTDTHYTHIHTYIYVAILDPTSGIGLTRLLHCREVESVAQVIKVLRSTTHNGFPVFGGDGTNKRVAGLILRKQLLVLLQNRVFVDEDYKPVVPAFMPR